MQSNETNETQPVIDDELSIESTTETVEEKTPEKVEEKKEESLDTTEHMRKKQNVTQSVSINTAPVTGGDSIVLPSNFDVETKNILDNIPNINLVDGEEGKKWAESISAGLQFTSFNETFVPALEEEGADFQQGISTPAGMLAGGSPRFKSAENQNLKGERALIRLNSHLGLGTIFQVPLWHTGIWITFKPPTESEFLELNRVLANDKIKFGRYTYGLAYSNILSYTTKTLIDFALSHVYDTTAKSDEVPVDKLPDIISCQDIPSLLWGFVCTMYPRGFRYERPCLNNPEKCNYVLEETLNVSKLQWTNNSALTEWQKTFMSNRQSNCKDLASIKRYQEELTKIQKKRVEINKDRPDNLFVTIKTPSIAQYIEAGHRWIDNIVNTVEKAVGANANDNERNSIIIKHGQATAMRQYSHWVESFEYDTNIIDDRDTIESVMETLSADDEIRTEFTTAVVDYINTSTISVIGIPVFDCPVCNTTQESTVKLPHHTNIIPIDVIMVFFELVSQRLNRLIAR